MQCLRCSKQSTEKDKYTIRLIKDGRLYTFVVAVFKIVIWEGFYTSFPLKKPDLWKIIKLVALIIKMCNSINDLCSTKNPSGYMKTTVCPGSSDPT